jgi:hypothetical protein
VIKAGNSEARYDITQRCYVFTSKHGSPKGLGFRLEAGTGSPAVNPAFVIENWGDRDVRLRVNGQEVKRGKDFRFGHIRRVNQHDLVVWVRLESERPVTMDLTPTDKD